MGQIDYSNWDGMNALRSFVVKNSWKASDVDWYKKLLQETYDAGKMPAKYKIVVLPDAEAWAATMSWIGNIGWVNTNITTPTVQTTTDWQSDMARMQPEMYGSAPVKKEEPNFVQVDEYTKKYPEWQKFTPTVPKIEGKTTMTDWSNTIARARSTIWDLNKKIGVIQAQLDQHQKNWENSAKIITPLSNQLDKLKKQKKAISLAMINKIEKEKYQPVINFVKQKMPGVANMFNL